MTSLSPPLPLPVVWHDLECHAYTADLALWHELARDPVLDVGAGTGRVALHLAAAGRQVTALDVDPGLLGALRDRAARRGLSVSTVCADARAFALDTRFAAILVPMQTIQLLGDRAPFLAAARRHLLPGGRLAIAIAEELESYEGDLSALPEPDVAERDGWRYVSQPVAVRVRGEMVSIERHRTVQAPDGTRTEDDETVVLALLSAARLEEEAIAAGFRPEPRRAIPPTFEHVGSTVVVLRG
jgi:SAM-dependent methyltransferase